MAKIKVISTDEFQSISEQAAGANELLNDPRWQFFRDYLNSSLEYIKESILSNSIRDVEETTRLSDMVSRTLKLSKKVQVDELSGQYKLITKFFKDMQLLSDIKVDLDTEIKAGRVKVNDQRAV